MKRQHFLRSLLLLSLSGAGLQAQDASLKNEVIASMQKGIGYLKSKQLETGAWVIQRCRARNLP